ncbi:MAG: ParB/RepB/Spo0J family partition protein [bacterium]
MSKQPLGRGLSALIPEAAKRQSAERIVNISVDDISPSPYQPRVQMNSELLEELSASIKEKGVVQPIIVRSLGNDKYEIIAGERRLRACKLAGLKEIPAIIREASDIEAMEIAITENIQREDLNSIELAKAYSALMTQFNLTQEQLAQAVGKSRSAVANIMRLLQLPYEVQENVLANKLSMGHARALLALENENLQMNLCRKIIEMGLSVRQTEKMVQKLLRQPKSNKTKKILNEEITAVEKRLRTLLATQVKIRQSGKKGKIEIEFYSVDDLDRITKILEAGLLQKIN